MASDRPRLRDLLDDLPVEPEPAELEDRSVNRWTRCFECGALLEYGDGWIALCSSCLEEAAHALP